MTLSEYLKSKESTQEAFASLIGVSQAAVDRYVKIKRIPRPEIMQRIVSATGGAVQPNDFHNLPTGDAS
jgi:predicted transcriptional regulator